MSRNFSVSLAKIVKEFKLESLYLPMPAEQIQISSADVNRPGLQMVGFYEYFDIDRIQVFGKAECAFLQQLPDVARDEILRKFFSKKPCAVIVARGIDVDKLLGTVFLDNARKNEVPVLRTAESTSDFMSSLITMLSYELAPRITRHGVLVEVYGEGVLLLGDSGVGKSETAVELVKRGHRLIADDAVEIRRASNKTLVGSSPENIRHFVELRGIGIINVRRLFGMGAVKNTEKINLIIQMEHWDPNKVYDRMGMEDEYLEVLGIEIPTLTIPVKPGRNLAIIIETAAMNNRQKQMGYNAAQELLAKLGMVSDIPEDNTGTNWEDY